MDISIVTGASKGIGLALARQLADRGGTVYCIARSKNEELAERVEGKVEFLTYDLSDWGGIDGLVGKITENFSESATSITVFNNAGVVEPIGQAGTNDADEVAKNIAVNLTAPMLITEAFIKYTDHLDVPRRIINISSGAGRNPNPGWSSYCATKAGLDHFSRVVAEEQKIKPNGVKVISIAPGIIDTDMQVQIRSSDEKDFAQVDRFISYKEQGLLSSPEDTAKKLITLLDRPAEELDTILDLRDF